MLDWMAAIHHDGSAVYVSNMLPKLSETVTIRLRVPRTASIKAIHMNILVDGEPRNIAMTIDKEADGLRWYTADLKMYNRQMKYYFRLMVDDRIWYYHASGISQIEQSDRYSFKLIADYQPPSWLAEAIFYQIFPDRFYNGDPALNPPEGVSIADPMGRVFETQMRKWDNDAPLSFLEGGMLDFFGGDLPGVVQKLDYLQELGVNAIYLNPIFASTSNHKYNINDFHLVDEHFGGNDALIRLRTALDEIGFKVVLDITTNHCGSDHKWFVEAQQDASSLSASYFIFNEHPDNYESWLGVPTLPKLNYKSAVLRDAMLHAEDAVMRFWLQQPYRIDGWRLDVWNMTARHDDYDANQEVGRQLKAAVKAENPDAYVVGESFFDATDNLQGDQLDGVMNYRGFTNPVLRWLVQDDGSAEYQHYEHRSIPAEVTAQQMQDYIAAIPWIIAMQQYNLLGSHDTPRILSIVAGDTSLAKLAATLLFTFPGVPSIYYGDEIGMAGWRTAESHRFPMRWNQAEWNTDIRGHYQSLIRIRRQSDALKYGGFQILHTQGDVLAYQRQSTTERLLIIGYRGEETKQLELNVWQAGLNDGIQLVDALGGETLTVEDGKLCLPSIAHGQALILREQ